MLDSIIRDVCKDMAPDLTDEQMRKLESVLYIHLHDLRIEEECTAIEPADQDNDARCRCKGYRFNCSLAIYIIHYH